MIDWILFLIIAGVCAITAGAMVPGKLPGGFFGAVVVGLIGAWLGITLSAPIQLSLAGESILPAIFGSAVLSFGYAYLSRKFAALEAKLDSALHSLLSVAELTQEGGAHGDIWIQRTNAHSARKSIYRSDTATQVADWENEGGAVAGSSTLGITPGTIAHREAEV